MLGYPSNHKGYRLWCLRLEKIIVCRDALFFENVLPLKLKSIAYLPSFGVDSATPKPTYKAVLEKSNQDPPSDPGLHPLTASEQAQQDLDKNKNPVASDEHPEQSDITAVPMDLDRDINDDKNDKFQIFIKLHEPKIYQVRVTSNLRLMQLNKYLKLIIFKIF